MEHQHHVEATGEKIHGDMQQMDNHAMQHGGNPAMGHAGHDHNAMINDFKKRFYVVLVLTLPIVLLSKMVQQFMGLHWQFTGSAYVSVALSSVVFFYGGWPFLTGLVAEVKARSPGMMFLIGFAITVSYVYSTAVVFGLQAWIFLGTGNTYTHHAFRALDRDEIHCRCV